jgi:hypothetical protein
MNDDKRNTRFYPSKFGLVQIIRQRVNQKLILKLEKKILTMLKAKLKRQFSIDPI